MGEHFEPIVRRLAEAGIVDLQGPWHSLLLAFVRKPDDFFFGKRGDPVEYVVDRDAVAAVADHVLESQLVHIIDRHGLKTPCRNAQKMAGRPAFLQRPLRRCRHIRIAITARRKGSVYVKKQISLSSHFAPQLSGLFDIRSQYILF